MVGEVLMTDGEKAVLVIAIVAVIAALAFMSMIPLGYMYGIRGWRMGPGMMGWGMMRYGWGPSILLWLVLIGVIAFGAYLLFNGSKVKAAPPQGRAIEILNERYAKGEISREDYLRMKEELQK
jgi:putative membrane protein